MQYVMQQLLAMQRFFLVTLVFITASIGLTGCGNKGPLYLPPEVVQEVSAPSESETTESEAIESETKESTESEETDSEKTDTE